MEMTKKNLLLLSAGAGLLTVLAAASLLYKQSEKVETPDSLYSIETDDSGASKLLTHQEKIQKPAETVKPANISAKVRPKDNSLVVSGTFETGTDGENPGASK